jgi:hypothetical protein
VVLVYIQDLSQTKFTIFTFASFATFSSYHKEYNGSEAKCESLTRSGSHWELFDFKGPNLDSSRSSIFLDTGHVGHQEDYSSKTGIRTALE